MCDHQPGDLVAFTSTTTNKSWHGVVGTIDRVQHNRGGDCRVFLVEDCPSRDKGFDLNSPVGVRAVFYPMGACSPLSWSVCAECDEPAFLDYLCPYCRKSPSWKMEA
jgi:hypothetical protein